MQRFNTFILSLIVVSGGLLKADDSMLQWVESLPKPWMIEEQQLQTILPQFQQQYPEFKQRLRAIAYWRLGTPYKIFNLGEEKEPDLDPIFRLDVSDCTSHILTSISLAQSNNWDEARQTLIQIHYKPDATGEKKPDYKRRWHYTSERILNHPITPQITDQYLPASELDSVTLVLNQKKDGSEFLNLDWTKEVTVRYIPSHKITHQLLEKLPDFVGVAFVKRSYFDMGVITAHEGMLLDNKYLLHAGQSAKETVKEDFMAYYFTPEGPIFDGIMLFEFSPSSLNL